METFNNLYISCCGFIEKLCKRKPFSKEIEEFLYGWISSIISYYEPSHDLLDRMPLKEYIKTRFHLLEQVKTLNIYSIHEMLKDKDSYLYKYYIKKLPGNFREKMLSFRLKKENEQFLLDKQGDYYLNSIGVCSDKLKYIEIIENQRVLYSFQHELEHINQGFFYPISFPFYKEMSEFLGEGAAEYQKALLLSSLPAYFLDEHLVSNYSYSVYYELYVLLMFILPKQMRKKWASTVDIGRHVCEQEKFFSSLFYSIAGEEEKRTYFSKIFALVTVLVARCKENDKKDDFLTVIEASSDYCISRIEEVQEIKEELKSNYKENMCEEEMKSLKEDLYEAKIWIAYYKFGENLNLWIKQLFYQKSSTEDLFEMLLEEIKEYLLRNSFMNSIEQLNYISSLESYKEKTFC